MSGFDVEVRTMLPNTQWVYLLKVADKNHTTVASLVRELVRRQLVGLPSLAGETAGPAPRKSQQRVTPEDDVRIAELNAQGWSDTAIAKELHMGISTVGARRERLGLDRNFGGRPKKEKTT